MAVEDTLNAIKAAGYRVIVAAEYDQDYWIVNLAKNRTANLKDWIAGRGQTLDDALTEALGRVTAKSRPKRKAEPSTNTFEDLLG